VRVTFSASTDESRSESVVVVNPINSQNMICTSKKFSERKKYHSTVSTSYTMNGGQTWIESEPPLQPGWDGGTDPDLTFDAFGNAYLIVEPLEFTELSDPDDLKTIGMYVFKSTDGGATWGTPVQLHLDDSDDKQWITSDMNPASPYHGAIYAVWGANTPLRFSRSMDHGVTWQGSGNNKSGADVLWPDIFEGDCYAPSISIGGDGTIHIVWHHPYDDLHKEEILYTRSTDGGNSFSPPISCVTGMKTLHTTLESTNGWPHFPNSTFRVFTMVTSWIAAGDRFIVAWADGREGVSRIYYRILDGDQGWIGPQNGQPLLPGYGHPDQHHFHPQLITAGNQVVGCTFYEFGLKNGQYLIDVKATFSINDGQSFSEPINVTDNPWDPAVNAPWSHGDPNVTFIGEYFGFDAFDDSFVFVWTDTRTGGQELFFDVVLASVVIPKGYDLFVTPWRVLYGLIDGSPGALINLITGEIKKWPLPDPVPPDFKDLHKHMLIHELAKTIQDETGLEVRKVALKSMIRMLQNKVKGEISNGTRR
jgi:hypothetical protein